MAYEDWRGHIPEDHPSIIMLKGNQPMRFRRRLTVNPVHTRRS
jgi:hypothetical protein